MSAFDALPTLERPTSKSRAARCRTAFVYVIQDGFDGHVKIGWATNPFDRIRQLQTGNSRALRLLYCEELTDKRAAARCEKSIHREFDGHRVRGEWFRFIGSLYQMVLMCTREGRSLVEQIRSWQDSGCIDDADDDFDDDNSDDYTEEVA